MKKLAFMFVAVVAMSFASCGNKAEKPAEETTDSTVVETVDSAACADSVCADSACADSACADSVK